MCVCERERVCVCVCAYECVASCGLNCLGSLFCLWCLKVGVLSLIYVQCADLYFYVRGSSCNQVFIINNNSKTFKKTTTGMLTSNQLYQWPAVYLRPLKSVLLPGFPPKKKSIIFKQGKRNKR